MEYDWFKYILPYVFSSVALLLQLYIVKQISPLDKKLAVFRETVMTLKSDNENQWIELKEIRSELDRLHGEHNSNHDRRSGDK
jgi:hypothetical protein